MALLEVQELSKYFGGIRAVDRCSFTVEEGSITALIGPNGAGKTTVFNLISGLLKLDTGMILLKGKQIDGMKPHQITRRGVRRTFQITRELMQMTVLENMVVQSPTDGFMDLIKGSILRSERDRAMELLDSLDQAMPEQVTQDWSLEALQGLGQVAFGLGDIARA